MPGEVITLTLCLFFFFWTRSSKIWTIIVCSIDEWTGGYHFGPAPVGQQNRNVGPEHPANRIFYQRNEQKQLYKLIEHVDIEYVFIAEKYKYENSKNLNPSLLLILVIISNAISRVVPGIQINNVLMNRCTARVCDNDALTIINEQFSVQLPDDEIGFIYCISIIMKIANQHGIIELLYNHGAIGYRKVMSINYSDLWWPLNIFCVLCNENKTERYCDIYEQFLEKDILFTARNSWNWTVSGATLNMN